MTSQDSTSKATEEASVRSGAEMADEVSRMFGALDVVLPKEVVCSWSLENMVSAEEMSDFLKLLEKACSLVGERRMTMLRKMSRIPQVSLKTFSNFETDRLSPNNRDVIKHLESLDFIGIGENVVIVGDQGTGKTHIAQAIGNRCCDSLFSVRYYKMEELNAKMKDYVIKGKQTDLITTLSNVQCLIIDEVGYCDTLGAQEANVFFQILDRRYDKGKKSTIFTSNKKPSEWKNLFPDVELAKCVLDRIMDRCIAVEIRGASYRGRNRKTFKLNCNSVPVITGIK